MREVITKTKDGFERDDGLARYIYDRQGKYLGQYQPDALSEGEIYLRTYLGDRCYHELTDEQMLQAETEA